MLRALVDRDLLIIRCNCCGPRRREVWRSGDPNLQVIEIQNELATPTIYLTMAPSKQRFIQSLLNRNIVKIHTAIVGVMKQCVSLWSGQPGKTAESADQTQTPAMTSCNEATDDTILLDKRHRRHIWENHKHFKAALPPHWDSDHTCGTAATLQLAEPPPHCNTCSTCK